MTVFTEARHTGEFIISEANGKRSRDTIIIAASQTLTPGTVLGKVTASGHYVILAPGASDGSQTAAAINIPAVTTGVGVTKPVAGLTRQCEVNGNTITWPGSITAPQKTAAIAQLAALGIMVR